MPTPPEPNYNYRINKLVKAYQEGINAILRELERLDLTDMQRAQALATLKNIADILSGIDRYSAEWVEEVVPEAVRGGVVNTMLALGVVETVEEAEAIVKFNRANQNLIRAAVADTQADLLAVTQNVDRKVRAAVRQVTAESMRANMAQGINGRRAISGDILQGLREQLGDSVNTGIIDASGRRWRPTVFVDMLTRTKLMETYNEATANEAVQRGAMYAVISSHGAKDACRFHEGRIIKLSADVEGTYPTYRELKAIGQIWHPNCRHTYSPIRRLDRLPERVLEKAEQQAERGSQAIATGKRNPQDVE